MISYKQYEENYVSGRSYELCRRNVCVHIRYHVIPLNTKIFVLVCVCVYMCLSMSVTDLLREYARGYVYVRVRVGELQSSSLAACEPARDCACTRTPASMWNLCVYPCGVASLSRAKEKSEFSTS